MVLLYCVISTVHYELIKETKDLNSNSSSDLCTYIITK